MEQRISLVTLGVADVNRARRFYERLGWRGQEVDQTVFYQAGGVGVVLGGRDQLAEDSGIADRAGQGAGEAGVDGFGGIALAHNVRSRAEVDEVLGAAAGAGAEITQPARRPSTAGTRGASPTRTAMSGRSRTTPASRSGPTARSPSPTSAPPATCRPSGGSAR